MLRPRLSFGVILCLATFCTSRAAEIPITGRALGGSGKPIPEADVMLLRAVDPITKARLDLEGKLPDAVARGRTDVEGHFEINAPDAGLYSVRIEAPGFVAVEHRLVPLLEPADLPDAELAQDVGLTVRATVENGRPLSGATARISPPRPRFGPVPPSWVPAARLGRTAKDGAVRMARGESEPLVLTVTAAGYLLEDRRNVRGTSAAFRLKAGVGRRIQVGSPDGRPVEGALVSAPDTLHPLGTTDARGSLVVSVPPAGSARVAVFASDATTAGSTASLVLD